LPAASKSKPSLVNDDDDDVMVADYIHVPTPRLRKMEKSIDGRDGVHLCVCTCLGGSERARSPFARRMGMIYSFTFDFSYICIVIIVNSNSIHGKDLQKSAGKLLSKMSCEHSVR
jgi:hypothetical protein